MSLNCAAQYKLGTFWTIFDCILSSLFFLFEFQFAMFGICSICVVIVDVLWLLLLTKVKF